MWGLCGGGKGSNSGLPYDLWCWSSSGCCGVVVGGSGRRMLAHILETSVAPRTARQASLQTWRLSLRTCSTTLGPCLLSQRRCSMPQALSASQFCLRCTITCMLPTRLAPPLPSTARQRVKTRQYQRRVFPTLVLLVPTLRWCDTIWPDVADDVRGVLSAKVPNSSFAEAHREGEDED